MAPAWIVSVVIVWTMPGSVRGEPGDLTLLDPTWVRPPAAYSDAQAVELRRAVALESQGKGREAEHIYSELARAAPRIAAVHANAARALYATAERISRDQREDRIELLERARSWADRGLAMDPKCTGCMLYKSAAMGRLAAIYGPLWGARHVKDLLELLDRGIELAPTDQDGPQNSTLGNLYFARATLYRTVPEWRWLRWVIGVRGDIDQSMRDIQRARAMHSQRLDYHVEHGVILLCRGARRSSPADTRQGIEVLKDALSRPARYVTDHKDQAMARELLGQPQRACEFSRDGFLSIEEHANHGPH